MIRRVVAAAGALTLLAPMGAVATAHATQYRYWTYWQGTADGWQFASVGPASSVPADGEVEGWRFAITEGVRGQGQEPRIPVSAAFRQFCGDREAPAGQKRVAVVFDFGEVADAPEGQTPPAPKGVCVVTSDGTNGAAVLSQAATIRTDRGLVCAIAGYPEGECAPALTPSQPPRQATRAPASTTAAEPARTKRSTKPEQAPASTPESVTPVPPTSGGAPAREDVDAGEPTARSKAGDDGGPRPEATAAMTPPPTPAATTAALPVFVEADAAVAEPATRTWAPVAAVAALLIAVGGFVWWRRRT